MAENIRTEVQDGTMTITVNRPDKMNALDRATIRELGEALDDAEKRDDVRVIVLTGAGEKAFVAGADIAEFADFSVEEGKELSQDGHDKLFNKLEHLSKPSVAAVNGFALGGGLELAMAAHMRVASSNAKLGLPETSLGVIPGYGGTQRLPRLVGKGKAMEMITTAGMIKADEAKEWGLVNHVTDEVKACREKAQELAGAIAKNSPTALNVAIRCVNAQDDHQKDGFSEEVKGFGECFGTGDFKEGTDAFLNKRKPEFKGE
jgi:enoyl-CoA hydratase